MPIDMTTLFTYLHFIGFIALGMFLAIEYAVLRKPLDDTNLDFIRKTDLFYGLSALWVLGTGMARIFLEKGWDYYSSNPFFWSKIALFVVMGVVSLLPTLTFIRNKNAGDISAMRYVRVKQTILFQILALFIIPFLAICMARGLN